MHIPVQYIDANVGNRLADRHDVPSVGEPAVPGGHIHCCFGGTIQIVQVCLELPPEIAHKLRRQRLATAHDSPQARAARRVGIRKEYRQHRGHKMRHRDAFLLNQLRQPATVAMCAGGRHDQGSPRHKRPE